MLSANLAVALEANIFLSRELLPSSANAAASFLNQDSGQAQLVISNPQAGPYYVLVQGREGAAVPEGFSLTPRLAGFEIRSVSPGLGGNAGLTTITVVGSGFTSASTVSLVSGSVTRTAATVLYKDDNTLFATFDLSGLNPGVFDVKVNDGPANTTLAGAFTVVTGSPGQVTYQLDIPANLRVGTVTTALITYKNTGLEDAPAPLLTLTSDNAEFRLSDQDPWQSSFIELLGYNANGPAGILPPGVSGTIAVEFLPITQGPHIPSDFTPEPPPPMSCP